MNEFASIESSSGILKDYYDPEKKSTEEALKRKRNRLFMTKMGKVPEDIKDQFPEGE